MCLFFKIFKALLYILKFLSIFFLFFFSYSFLYFICFGVFLYSLLRILAHSLPHSGQQVTRPTLGFSIILPQIIQGISIIFYHPSSISNKDNIQFHTCKDICLVSNLLASLVCLNFQHSPLIY